MIYTDIDRYVEKYREEAVDFLKEMIQTPSPTGEELEISKVVMKWLKRENLPVEVYAKEPTRPNIISNWCGNPDGRKFMFKGHYDVFPPTVEEKKVRDPWSGEIIDGNIYGKGSVDMKAGLAAGIMAVKLLKRSGFIPNGSISISCVCDEEQGGKYGTLYLISQGLLDADFGVCMEASEDSVIVESDGRIAYSVTYQCEGWHAGLRKNRDNAIQKSCKAIERLYQYDDVLKRERNYGFEEGGAILSITEIHAGEASNIQPDSCTFSVDRRYTKGETIESATKELKEVLDELKMADPDMDYQLDMPIANPQLSMDTNNLCIRAAVEAAEEVLRKTIKLGRRCSGGDTSKITSAYGYPLPQFGPGRFNQLCTPTEHVDLDEYINFIKIYMRMVMKLL